jgi:hypothetical protein
MGRKIKQDQVVIDEVSVAQDIVETTPETPEVPTPEAEPTPEPTPAPAPAKAAKLTPAERAAARIAARDAIREKGEVARNAAGRPDARGLTCLCGCGDPTHRDEAMFKSGHDARLRKNVIFGKLDRNGLPLIVRPWFDLREPIAGLLLDEDGVTILDVKAGGGGISEDHELA